VRRCISRIAHTVHGLPIELLLRFDLHQHGELPNEPNGSRMRDRLGLKEPRTNVGSNYETNPLRPNLALNAIAFVQ
jgi:hypothetical protein